MTNKPESKPGKIVSRKSILWGIVGVELACIAGFLSMILVFRPSEVSFPKINLGKSAGLSGNTSQAYLPGISPQEIRDQLIEEDFDCGSYRRTEEKGLHLWKCEKQEGNNLYEVFILSRTQTTVDLIDANINQSDDFSNELASAYLCSVAALPYHGAEQQEICDWIEETLPQVSGPDDTHLSVFNGVNHMLYGGPDARSLEIGRLP